MRSTFDGIRALGWLGLLGAFLVAMPFVGVGVLTATRDTWLGWFEPAGVAAAALFVGLSTVLCGLSLIPTYAVALVSGYVFGTGAGIAVALVSIPIAAWFGRAILVPIVGDRLLDFVRVRPRAAAVHAVLLGQDGGTATAVVTLVRLAPVTPFAGTNLLMAAAKVGLVPYLIGTIVGLGPRTALVAAVGAGLAELQFDADAGRTALWWTIGSLTVAVVGLGVLARRKLRQILAVTPRFAAGAEPERSGPTPRSAVASAASSER